MTAHLSFLFSVLCSLQATQRAAAPGQVAGPVLVWGDFDRDGRQDAYAVRSSGSDRLLRNLGDGSFEDATAQALPRVALASRSAAWGDADGDGWLDLYAASAQGGGRLFQNLGNGAFAERTREAGISGIVLQHDARWFDYDGDGRADLLLASPGGEILLGNRGNWVFERVALPHGLQADPVASVIPVALEGTSVLHRATDDGTASHTREHASGDAVAPFGPLVRDSGRVSLTSGPSTSDPGTASLLAGGKIAGVPHGFMIVGETPSPPGGYTSTGWQLDVASGAQLWASKASMATARYGPAAVTLDGKVYAMGGYDGAYLATVEQYDPASNTWSSKASMSTTRIWLAAAALDGKVYAIGGHNGVVLATVEAYDPASDSWSSRASMPTALYGLAAVAFNGKIYALGASVAEYDPVSDSWSPKAPMPTPRLWLAAASLNGKIYAIGGSTSASGTATATVEEYDPASNTWASKFSMPTARYALAAAVLGGKIYAIGGVNGSSSLMTVEEYDPFGNDWSSKLSMSTARSHLAAAALEGKIYAVGGLGGPIFATADAFESGTRTLFLHRRN